MKAGRLAEAEAVYREDLGASGERLVPLRAGAELAGAGKGGGDRV